MSLPEKPITRQESYLSVMANQHTTAILPEKPITREEAYLDYIARHGGGGGGGAVDSVNGKTGEVVLTASDVDALPDSISIPTSTSDLENDSNFVSDENYVHTDNNFTSAEKQIVSDANISSASTGTAIDITDSANARMQDMKIYGSASGIGSDGLTVTACGKNMFDINENVNMRHDSQSMPNWYEDTSEHKNTVSNGVLTAYYDNSTSWGSGQLIRVKPDTKYTISATVVSLGTGTEARIRADISGGKISESEGWGEAGDRISRTFTVPSNVDEICFVFFAKNGNNAQFTDIQMEEGETLTTFVPFTGSTIPVSTGLPLRAVGDVKDVIDFSSGAVITRIANDGETVLSQPVVTQLSATELQAWRNFRTADEVTHISATDSPVIDVIYINNTGNGKAVARVQDVEGSVYRTLYFNDYATTQAQSITLSESYKNFEELEITLLRISDSGTRVSPRVFTIPVEALTDAGTTTMLPVLTATYWSSEYIQYSITNDTTLAFVGTSSGTNSTLVIAKIVGVGADAVRKQVIGGVDVDKAYVDAGLATKQDIIQVATMPAASPALLGTILQFVGTTDSTYTNGYYYKCQYSGGGMPVWRAKTVQKSTKVIDFTITLSANLWSGDSAPYTWYQGLSTWDVLATDKPILDVVVSDTVSTGIDQIKQWGYISKAVCGDQAFTFYCYENKPTIDLTVNVKVVREE